MDPDSEVKKRKRLTKYILKLKDNKLAGVWIESSGSRKPRMLRKSLSKSGYRNWTKELWRVTKLDRLDQTRYLGAVMLAKACWIFDDDSKIWDDHLSLDYRLFSCESLDQSECLWMGCSLRLSWIARRLLDDLE
ncbi:hypothetical protein DY000_02054242 [Brassica cretica]|uniref:Uncharacterized protein n=1 Tax=Brassica cretica TaxID=69181 RepID=A0ABQ7AA38_BRACR|nr:hypothetical protein DY000_02054242 [Brassica cretica]